MKIALAQINSTVGDLSGNARKILTQSLAAQKQGADLVLFPELALVGYPPRDVLEQPGFFAKHEQALKQLLKDLPQDIAVVFGALGQSSNPFGVALQNMAYVVAEGKILLKQAKQLLPNYDIFDEPRHFFPAEQSVVFTWKGVRFGVSICEDLWFDVTFQERNLYERKPLQNLALQGAEVALNLSASPFESNKLQRRLAQLSQQAAALHLPFFYCNSVGALDEIIFDGFSCAVTASGETQVLAQGFQEELLVVGLPFLQKQVPQQFPNELELMWQALKLGLSDYLAKTGFEKVLLGLSGGVDSALVALLAVEALGAQNVSTFMLTSPYTSQESVAAARELAKNLQIQHQEISIETSFAALKTALNIPASRLSLTEENLQARIRGTMLMALANEHKSLLLVTSNKSELAMGYSTLYGDMCGALAPLGDLLKTQIYQLVEYVNRDKKLIPEFIITRPPSAELKPNQTDQDTLPPYAELDKILQAYLVEQKSPAQIIAGGSQAKTMHWVIKQLHGMEYKRKQAPPILRVSTKAFGIGRRMPIAWNFSELSS